MFRSTRAMRRAVVAGSLVLFCSFVSGVEGQNDRDRKVSELEEKIEILTEEWQALREELGEGATGAEDKMHFHGYGELHYNNTSEEGENDKVEFLRMVIGLSYEFTESIILDAEVDFEHAATEIELEYAHLDLLINDAFNLRMGSMLMPVGYLNELHGPPRFYSVERPYVQRYVIPTTWQEGGLGALGSPVPEINYRVYVVGGLDASGFKGDSGIRKGRGKVASAKADDLAVVGRLEYGGITGFNLGVSGYFGDAAQGDPLLGNASVSIVEGDIRYRRKNVELTALMALADIDDTEKINALTGEVIGEEILGWYLEAAYHAGELFLPEGQDLVLFVRHEQFNTQEEVASGFVADPHNDREVTSFGVAYYPVPQVVIKADLENWEDGAGSDWDQFNIGVGYEF